VTAIPAPFPNDPGAKANWVISHGNFIVSGSGTCNNETNPTNWSGVNNVVVPVRLTPYYVNIWWWDSYYGWYDEEYYGVNVDEHGQVVRLEY
jgi:hypothetical protein